MSLITQILVGIIRGYQYLLSPFFGTHCRFTPSCSQYGIDALSRYGVVEGGILVLRRLSRCHPWCEGGHDPVP